jgi:chemotaxis protein MotA
MNISTISGFIIAASIIWLGVIKGAQKPEIFLDEHAILLVLGGTIAAALISFPVSRLLKFVKMFAFGVILKRQSSNEEIIKEIISIAASCTEQTGHLAVRVGCHPLLTDGYHLIAEDLLDPDALETVLKRRSAYFKKQYQADAKALTSLAKYPPAFGLLATSTGMIAMMSNLSGGQDKIGPAMAVALVATFWGIALANFILLPLADYASRLAQDDTHTRDIIIDGLLMIKKRESLLLISEKLKAFLSVDTEVSKDLNQYKAAIQREVKKTPDAQLRALK